MESRLQISRRNLLKAGALLCGGAVLAGFGYATYEPYDLSVEHVNVHLARLPAAFAGFRMTQLSDIHFGEFILERHVAAVVEAVNATRPDLVVITGDFVTEPVRARERPRAAERAWPCGAILRNLRARFGVIATLGNHDYKTGPDIVTEALTHNRIAVLRNRAQAIELGGARFWIAGVDDALEHHADPDAALRAIPAGEAVIAAVHEPDFADVLKAYPLDLQISGHSHGGQIRLPLIGPPYLPPLARKYPIGFRRVGALPLYTNRGVGVIGLPFRFMCRPELTVFTLNPKSRSTS